ncbi:MAG: hypothetical protein EP335_05735 [Alphaproteobacteria bacterium]|nr:MAG: hypothetical protein EP335_05735 [Alphaproteobacteria bacterium]
MAEDFFQLVHRHLSKIGDGELAIAAGRLGMKYHNFYSRLAGRAQFRPDEIRRLLKYYPERDFFDYFLADTNFFAAPKPVAQCDSSRSVEKGAAHSVLEAADVLRAVEDSLKDNKIDHRERSNILREIEAAEGALASLRASLQVQ